MMRTWKTVALSMVVAGALTAAPAPAQNSDTPKTTDTSALVKQLEELKKSLDGLSTKVTSLESRVDKDLKELQGKLPLTDVNVAQAQKDVNELKTRLGQLERDLELLKNRPPSQVSAGYAPSGQMAAATGRVRLVNTFFQPVAVVVNGREFIVAPNETRTADSIPAGVFTYEVRGVQPQLSRSLAANETFTISVYPR
jgi:hypothetical protein